MPRLRSSNPLFTVLALVLVVIAVAIFLNALRPPHPPPSSEAEAEGYLFCFWNVQDLFDDRVDGRTGRGDAEVDRWFGTDHAALNAKLDHLSSALLTLNGEKGPDILAVAEVEDVRAAELLQDALNRKLSDPALHYQHVLMKEITAGRHIAPAILTRLPVMGDRTHLLGNRLRILEGHITVRDHDLVVIASHWTSRVTAKEEMRRDKYASQIYGEFHAMFRTNPKVDLLVCGDCNDPPDAESVTQHLHATGDVDAVRHSSRDRPLLLNLFAGKDPAHFGTLYYDKEQRWFIFDQIVVSPGMLDNEGWSCDPESARTVNDLTADRHGHPWSFGKEHSRGPRGYSDHFPVTVRLRVN
jgi:endonuclease/exonuclease/phosphatase family metal-dependent hydrolase